MTTPTIWTPWRTAPDWVPTSATTIKTINAAGGVLNYLIVQNRGQQTFGKVWIRNIAGTHGAINAGYNDRTTEAGNDTLADVELFQTDSVAQGDEVYLGFAAQWNAMSFLLSTNGTNSTVTWAYSAGGGTFTTLTPDADGTNNLRQSGVVKFTPPGGWATDTVNGVGSLYWIRIKNSTAEFGVAPVATKVLPGLLTPLVSAYLVPSGGSAEDKNALCRNIPIMADGAPHNVLAEGGIDFVDCLGSDFIQVVCDAYQQVHYWAGGLEFA